MRRGAGRASSPAATSADRWTPAERPVLDLVGELLGGRDEWRVVPARTDERRSKCTSTALVECQVEDDVPQLVDDHLSARRHGHAHRRAPSVDVLARVGAETCLRPADDVHRAVELGEQRPQLRRRPAHGVEERSALVPGEPTGTSSCGAANAAGMPLVLSRTPRPSGPTWYARSYASDVLMPKATRREPRNPFAVASG